MNPRINVITLGVKDFARSLAFYRDGLGWTAQVNDDIAFFPLNGIVLALYPRDRLAEDAMVPARENGFPGFTLAYNTRNEDEVDATLKLAEDLGGHILKLHRKHSGVDMADILPTLMVFSGKSRITRSGNWTGKGM
jgi:catechol 2,3-dioxygenase-like lactoylglutathione lyase family enzyme